MLATTPLKTKEEHAKPLSDRPWSEVKKSIVPADQKGVHWYAVHCAGASDDRVRECLKRIGFEIFIPQCLELRAVPKRKLPPNQRNSVFPIKKPTAVALFPRYPFIHGDLDSDNRYEAFKLLNVQGILCMGDVSTPIPAMIPDAAIKKLMENQSGGTLRSGTTLKQLAYEMDELVRIGVGPFAGFDATVHELPDVPIEQLDETSRIKLLVSMFGRQSVVEVSLADIEKL